MSDTAASATSAIAQWTAKEPRPTGAYDHDVGHYGAFWKGAEMLMRRLPAKPRRSPDEAVAAETILAAARQSREHFLAAHAERLYDRLTDGARFVRLESSFLPPPARCPAWCRRASSSRPRPPSTSATRTASRSTRASSSPMSLADRAQRRASLPRHAAAAPGERRARRPSSPRDGSLDLGAGARRAPGQGGPSDGTPIRASSTPRTTPRSAAMEIGVDVAMLDPDDRDRGAARRRGRARRNIAGRRMFGAGINLTHLYRGKIPVPLVPDPRPGLRAQDPARRRRARTRCPTTCTGDGIEKPWIAAVDAFAIGGHCQMLLCDGLRPRRRRRLPDPAGAQGRHHSRASPTCACRASPATASRARRSCTSARCDCDSAEGRLICDEIAPRGRDGRRDRARRRRPDQRRRRRRHRQPPRLPRRRRSRSTCSAATPRSTRASRRIATDGSTNTAVSLNHSQEFSKDSHVQANLNFVTSTALQRQNTFNPYTALATIASALAYQTKLGPASVTVGGTRTQYPGRQQIDETVPTVNLTSAPITLGEFFSWTPGFSYSQHDVFKIDQPGIGAYVFNLNPITGAARQFPLEGPELARRDDHGRRADPDLRVVAQQLRQHPLHASELPAAVLDLRRRDGRRYRDAHLRRDLPDPGRLEPRLQAALARGRTSSTSRRRSLCKTRSRAVLGRVRTDGRCLRSPGKADHGRTQRRAHALRAVRRLRPVPADPSLHHADDRMVVRPEGRRERRVPRRARPNPERVVHEPAVEQPHFRSHAAVSGEAAFAERLQSRGGPEDRPPRHLDDAAELRFRASAGSGAAGSCTGTRRGSRPRRGATRCAPTSSRGSTSRASTRSSRAAR